MDLSYWITEPALIFTADRLKKSMVNNLITLAVSLVKLTSFHEFFLQFKNANIQLYWWHNYAANEICISKMCFAMRNEAVVLSMGAYRSLDGSICTVY